MDSYKEEVKELFNEMKSSKNYETRAKNLINILSKVKEPNENILISIILLNFILGNFSLSTLRRNKIERKKLEILANINEKNDSCPYPNIATELSQLKMDHQTVQMLVEAFAYIYKKKQIEFISQFYSKITVEQLADYLGKDFLVTEEFLKENRWKKEKNYFLTSFVKSGTTPHYSPEDVEFIGKMTTQLEKITQAHQIVKG